MSLRFKSLLRVLCVGVLAHSAQAAVSPALKPSDCEARDADSTCATAVAGVAAPGLPPFGGDAVLYDGPLGGVPATGYAYWGFDFVADQTGLPSPVRPDEFINRSSAPVTIRLSFTFPTNHPCANDCLPGAEFVVDAGWLKIDPPYVIAGNSVSISQVIAPGRGYGWVIGLWQSSHPRLTVTIPAGSQATLQDVGLSPLPAIANDIAAVTSLCTCWDGSTATCSEGRHFSNGLLGAWDQEFRNYHRAGAFNNCAAER